MRALANGRQLRRVLALIQIVGKVLLMDGSNLAETAMKHHSTNGPSPASWTVLVA